jgi:hypothetical protein
VIISHEHKFIFIKTHKTAGTSIEISLSRFCGPDDLLTFVSPKDEDIRRQHNGRAPRKVKMPRWKFLGDMAIDPRNFRENLKSLTSGEAFRNHLGARAIRQRVRPDVWKNYFKFCFERNPWDKTVSDYFWKKKNYNNNLAFGDYIARGEYPVDHPQYCLDGDVVVDRVGRYETLERDLSEICTHLGIPFDGWLPHAKGGLRPEQSAYRDFYNEKQKDVIARFFRKEIDCFGYSF